MKRLNRKILCLGTCLILTLCFGTWIEKDDLLPIHGKFAFAQGKEPEKKEKTGSEAA